MQIYPQHTTQRNKNPSPSRLFLANLEIMSSKQKTEKLDKRAAALRENLRKRKTLKKEQKQDKSKKKQD